MRISSGCIRYQYCKTKEGIGALDLAISKIEECFEVKDSTLASMGKILEALVQEIPSDLSGILLIDEEDRIVFQESRRCLKRQVKSPKVEIVKEAIKSGNPVILSRRNPEGFGDLACMPLVIGSRPVGGIYLQRNDHDGEYSSRDLDLLAAFSRPIHSILKRAWCRKKKKEEGVAKPSHFVGKSREHIRILRLINRVKDTDVPVFISGESGTGKEVVARTIHESGRRKTGGFVAINCGSIPDHLLESELFGYVRGAFTGALRDRRGLIEEANGGTFFLDEIGDLSLPLQAKLLRVIQEKEIRRIGENHTRPIDTRFISATNKDIENEVREKRFREDLYYRLKIMSVELPPLRARKEDILCLLRYHIEKYCREMRREMVYFTPDVLKLLLNYPWPGNVRELQNEIQRCLILCGEKSLIGKDCLSFKFRQAQENEEESSVSSDYFRAKADFEKRFLNEALSRTNYNRTRTAEEIGLSRQGLFKLMKKHGILSE
jgi:transcriptional regulator with PAS, ATPase and Fis domain